MTDDVLLGQVDQAVSYFCLAGLRAFGALRPKRHILDARKTGCTLRATLLCSLDCTNPSTLCTLSIGSKQV